MTNENKMVDITLPEIESDSLGLDTTIYMIRYSKAGWTR